MAKLMKCEGGWNGASIKALLLVSDGAVARAVTVLAGEQTSDEIKGKHTWHDNKVGFNKMDAEFGTSLAERLAKGKSLTEKQAKAARRMVIKYRVQLANKANAALAVAVATGLANIAALAASDEAANAA